MRPSDRQALSSIRLPQGFTLLEVMVSFSIIAIALGAVFRLQSQSVSMANRAKFEITAPLLAHGKMAQYMGGATDGLTDDAGDFGEHFQGYAWKVTVEPTEIESLESQYGTLYRIDLVVTWGNDVYHHAIRSYRLVVE